MNIPLIITYYLMDENDVINAGQVYSGNVYMAQHRDKPVDPQWREEIDCAMTALALKANDLPPSEEGITQLQILEAMKIDNKANLTIRKI